MQSNFEIQDSDLGLVKRQSEIVKRPRYEPRQNNFNKNRTIPANHGQKGQTLAMDSGLDANDPERSPTQFDWDKPGPLGKITEEREGQSDHSGLPARTRPQMYVSEPPKYDERPKINTEVVKSSFGDEPEDSPPHALYSVPPPESPHKKLGATPIIKGGSRAHKFSFQKESTPADSFIAPVTRASLGKFHTHGGKSFGRTPTLDSPPTQRGMFPRPRTEGSHTVVSTDGHMSFEMPIQIDEVVFSH
jgi:hypothetical protein